MVKNIKNNIPEHVAIIMDGNGRWAKARGLSRSEGHKQGAETVRTIIKAALKSGVKYLTIYAFSTENWNRPKEEVDAIMELLVVSLENETEELKNNGIRLTAIGNIEQLSDKAKSSLKKSIEATKDNIALNLIVALNYGSRDEILRAVNKISLDVDNKILKSGSIDEATFEKYLYTSGTPDPDLLIRTSGEQRISNYLLWQLAYTEIYFTPTTWPDFTEEDFFEALKVFSERERRYGKTSEQIQSSN